MSFLSVLSHILFSENSLEQPINFVEAKAWYLQREIIEALYFARIEELIAEIKQKNLSMDFLALIKELQEFQGVYANNGISLSAYIDGIQLLQKNFPSHSYRFLALDDLQRNFLNNLVKQIDFCFVALDGEIKFFLPRLLMRRISPEQFLKNIAIYQILLGHYFTNALTNLSIYLRLNTRSYRDIIEVIETELDNLQKTLTNESMILPSSSKEPAEQVQQKKSGEPLTANIAKENSYNSFSFKGALISLFTISRLMVPAAAETDQDRSDINIYALGTVEQNFIKLLEEIAVEADNVYLSQQQSVKFLQQDFVENTESFLDKNVEVVLREAARLNQVRNYDKEIRCYQTLLGVISDAEVFIPKKTEWRTQLAIAQLKAGKISEAQQSYQLSIDNSNTKENNAKLHFRFGRALLEKSKNNSSLASSGLVALKQAYLLAPKIYLTDYADALVSQGDIKTAVSLWENSVAKNQRNTLFYNKLGDWYQSVKDFNNAIKAYQTSLKIDAKQAAIQYKLGLQELMVGSVLAQVQFNEALKLNVTNSLYKWDLRAAEYGIRLRDYSYEASRIQRQEAEQFFAEKDYVQAYIRLRHLIKIGEIRCREKNCTPEEIKSLGDTYFRFAEVQKKLPHPGVAPEIVLESINKGSALTAIPYEYLEFIGDLHVQLEQYEDALEYYQATIIRQPKNFPLIIKFEHILRKTARTSNEIKEKLNILYLQLDFPTYLNYKISEFLPTFVFNNLRSFILISFSVFVTFSGISIYRSRQAAKIFLPKILQIETQLNDLLKVWTTSRWQRLDEGKWIRIVDYMGVKAQGYLILNWQPAFVFNLKGTVKIDGNEFLKECEKLLLESYLECFYKEKEGLLIRVTSLTNVLSNDNLKKIKQGLEKFILVYRNLNLISIDFKNMLKPLVKDTSRILYSYVNSELRIALKQENFQAKLCPTSKKLESLTTEFDNKTREEIITEIFKAYSSRASIKGRIIKDSTTLIICVDVQKYQLKDKNIPQTIIETELGNLFLELILKKKKDLETKKDGTAKNFEIIKTHDLSSNERNRLITLREKYQKTIKNTEEFKSEIDITQEQGKLEALISKIGNPLSLPAPGIMLEASGGILNRWKRYETIAGKLRSVIEINFEKFDNQIIKVKKSKEISEDILISFRKTLLRLDKLISITENILKELRLLNNDWLEYYESFTSEDAPKGLQQLEKNAERAELEITRKIELVKKKRQASQNHINELNSRENELTKDAQNHQEKEASKNQEEEQTSESTPAVNSSQLEENTLNHETERQSIVNELAKDVLNQKNEESKNQEERQFLESTPSMISSQEENNIVDLETHKVSKEEETALGSDKVVVEDEWVKTAPMYSGQINGEKRFFIEKKTREDNVFNLLNISHEEFFKALETISMEKLRPALAAEIKVRIFSDYVFNFAPEVVQLIAAYKRINNKIDQLNQQAKKPRKARDLENLESQLRQIDLKITVCCQADSVIKNYIEQLKNENLTPSYHCLLLYAESRDLSVTVWCKKNEGSEIEILGSRDSKQLHTPRLHCLMIRTLTKFIPLEIADVKVPTVKPISTLGKSDVTFFKDVEISEQKKKYGTIRNIVLQAIPLRRYYKYSVVRRIGFELNEKPIDLAVYIDACYFRLLRFNRALAEFLDEHERNKRFAVFGTLIIHVAGLSNDELTAQRKAIDQTIEKIEVDFLRELLPPEEYDKIDDPQGLLKKLSKENYQKAADNLNIKKLELFKNLDALWQGELKITSFKRNMELILLQIEKLKEYFRVIRKQIAAGEGLEKILLTYSNNVDACAMKITNIGQLWTDLRKFYIKEAMQIDFDQLEEDLKKTALIAAGTALKEQYKISDNLSVFLDECSLDRNTFGHIFRIEPGVDFLKLVQNILKKDLIEQINLIINSSEEVSSSRMERSG